VAQLFLTVLSGLRNGLEGPGPLEKQGHVSTNHWLKLKKFALKKGSIVMKATTLAIILGCILNFVVSSPAITQAFVITLDPENTIILQPTNGMVLRAYDVPPDPRLGQAVVQFSYEHAGGVPQLFNLHIIAVERGFLNLGIQYENGEIAVYNDLGPSLWALGSVLN
jgi:hypothetical protein